MVTPNGKVLLVWLPVRIWEFMLYSCQYCFLHLVALLCLILSIFWFSFHSKCRKLCIRTTHSSSSIEFTTQSSVSRGSLLDLKHTCLANDLHGCPYCHYEYVLISRCQIVVPHFHCYSQHSFRL
jgi:hypothetical protein